ncbi:MAG: AAA family ATPase [Caldilineaceae bacterium]
MALALNIALNDVQQQALFAYLALHRDAPICRHELGQRLWPNLPPADSIVVLNHTLDGLRHSAPDIDHLLMLTADAVQWNADAAYSLDVNEFEAALTRAQAAERVGDAAIAEQQFQQAVQYYGGKLLPNCDDEWLNDERSRLHTLYIDALTHLVPLLERKGEYAQAVEFARLLRQHSLQYEHLHRRLTHLYVLSGGRAALLQVLEQRLEATLRGQGVLVLIEGAAGIGKTSLALACAEQARGRNARFVVGHCYERGVTSPFMPWQELVAALALAGQIDRGALPEPFGQEAPKQSAYQLFQVITSQLQAVALQQPLVLLFDDLHWADQDSLDLLDFATRQLADRRLLILVTYRSEEVHRASPLFNFLPTLQRNRPLEHIRLGALTLDDTTRLIEGYHGPCSPQLARYLYARAEGHPLFLVQLLQDLVERDLLTLDQLEGWLPPAQTIPAPTLLQQVISARVARLGARTEQLLEVAAVVGETWQLAIVEALLGWPEEQLLVALEQGLAAGVITPIDPQTERYRFGHGLIREVLYSRQLARRRKQYHKRIAALLAAEETADIEALAHHCYQAEAWPQAYTYSLAAGNVARRRYAMHSALQFYRQALNALQRQDGDAPVDTRLALYERLGKTYAALNHKEEAVSTFMQLAELAHAASNLRLEGHALIHLSVSQDLLYRNAEAAATTQAALQVAEKVDDPHVLTLSHFLIGRRLLLAGDLGQASHHFGLAERYANATEEPAELLAQVWRMKIYLTMWSGRYTQAERMAREALDLARQARHAIAIAALPFQLGYILTEQGHYEQAWQLLQQGVSDVEQLGERHQYLPKLLNTFGYLAHEVGDLNAALHWNHQALAASRHEGVYYHAESACYALLDLATSRLQQGRLTDAEAYAQEFESIQERVDYARYRPLNRYQLLCAQLALAAGDYEVVLHHTAQAAALAREKNFPKNIAKSLLYTGQALLYLGRAQSAVERLQQAVALAEQIKHAALRWQTRLRLAEAYALLGQPNAELYQQATALVDELAANLHDHHLRSCFLGSPLVVELRANARSALEHKPAPPSANTPFPAGLTAREVEVLRLVTAGSTNRQIAKMLHLSVGTVNSHLTHILNKTGCENRTAAAAFALQHGLAEPA